MGLSEALQLILYRMQGKCKLNKATKSIKSYKNFTESKNNFNKGIAILIYSMV